MKTFQGHGISFQYQPSWDFLREIGSDRIDISVHGPGTAMWSVSILQNRPNTDDIVKEIIGSYLDEYSTCDVYDAEEAICLMPTVSKDIDFFSHDLITHVHVRACEGETETILLIYQIADVDGEESYDILRAMADSLILQDPNDDDADIDEGEIPAYRYHNLFADTNMIEPEVTDEEVRRFEQEVGMPTEAIAADLLASGDEASHSEEDDDIDS